MLVPVRGDSCALPVVTLTKGDLASGTNRAAGRENLWRMYVPYYSVVLRIVSREQLYMLRYAIRVSPAPSVTTVLYVWVLRIGSTLRASSTVVRCTYVRENHFLSFLGFGLWAVL
jgi:hypothetical protein